MRNFGAAIALAVGVLSLAGCLRSKVETFVPIQKSAAEQYRYAANYRANKTLSLRDARDLNRMMETREAVRQHFEKVAIYFPEDRSVTPLARLEVAEMVGALDHERAASMVSRRDRRRAIKQFQTIRKEYPEIDFIQAKTSFDEALCLKNLKEYEKAQEMFRKVKEQYATHKDDTIKSIARLASFYYQQTYVK